MDALGEVLDSLQLKNVLYRQITVSTPWGVAFTPSRLAVFHVVLGQGGWLQIEDESPDKAIPIQSGDVVVLTRGDAHFLKDKLESPLYTRLKISPDAEVEREIYLEHELNQDSQTKLICGGYYFERGETHPLLSLLPPIIHLKGESSAGWLDSTLKFLESEVNSERPGNSTLLKRLIDILFIQVVRAWLESQPKGAGGWIGALRDPQIGQALGIIHREADQEWTVAGLAAQVSMSRSAFSARFSELVGEAPAQYLTRWRMHLAAKLLQRETNLSIAEIALRVSYESETAFSKVFKRQFGVAPGIYRRNLGYNGNRLAS